MTIENQVNTLESQVANIDTALVDISDRMDQLDDGNSMVQNFVVAELQDTAHLDMLDQIGEKVSARINTTAIVNRPTGIKCFAEGEATIISYYQRLVEYTEEFAIDSIYPSAYQNPNANNEGIGYSFGFDVDQTSGNFAICAYVRHICRVYSSAGDLLFTIGTPASAGHVSAGKLYNPVRPMFLPNGNILISNYNGYGDGCTNHGHLSEYSGTDGSFVATHLGFLGDGQSAIGSNIIYRPMQFDVDKTDSNLLWVSEYGRGRVLVVNMATWLVEDIYYAPPGYSFGTSYGVACLSDGNFAIASNTQASIMVIDRLTKELIVELDTFKVGAAPDFRDVKEFKPGFLIFSAWSSAGVFVMPINNEMDITYTQPALPANANLISDIQFPAYDASTGTLTRKINDLDDVPNKITVPYSKIIL